MSTEPRPTPVAQSSQSATDSVVTSPGHRSRRWPWFLLVLFIAGIAAYLLWGKSGISGNTRGTPAAKAVPVLAVAAKTEDMPVYLYGLGSATALNTVTIQARVSGELIKVAYKEGQDIHTGDLLCEIDPRPFQAQLAQDEGALERDQALLENAQLELDRYVQAKEAIPQQTIDTQRATVLQDQGNVKTDQAQVDSTKLNLNYCEITSPIDGRVGLRLVDEGNQVSANSTLVVVTQVKPITVLFNLPENDIPQVAPKWQAGQQLPAVAYDPSLTRQLAIGSLLAFDNQVNPNAGTFQLKAIFPNEDSALFPNQFVNVRLLVDTLPKMVVIPTSAVQIGPQSSFVYVVKADNTVEQRTVTPGHVEGELQAITKGLNDGEIVVTDGFDKLQPDLSVSVTRPDAPAVEKSAPSK